MDVSKGFAACCSSTLHNCKTALFMLQSFTLKGRLMGFRPAAYTVFVHLSQPFRWQNIQCFVSAGATDTQLDLWNGSHKGFIMMFLGWKTHFSEELQNSRVWFSWIISQIKANCDPLLKKKGKKNERLHTKGQRCNNTSGLELLSWIVRLLILGGNILPGVMTVTLNLQREGR